MPTAPTETRTVNSKVAVFCTVLFVAAMAAIVIFSKKGQPRPDGDFLKRPAAFVQDIVKSEDTYDAANASVKKTFVKGLKSRDWALAATGLTKDFRGRFPAKSGGKVVPDEGLSIREYTAEGLEVTGADKFLEAIRSHVESWSAIERTTWRTFEFLLAPDEKSAFVSIHFTLGGLRPDRTRAEIAGILQGSWVTADGKTWQVRELGWMEGFGTEAQRPPWNDITDATGLHFNESEERRKLRQAVIDDRGVVTAGGLTVADFNRDGFPDVLATRVGTDAELFLNDARGGFRRASSPVSNPEDIGMCWIYADLDNDGVEELVSSHVEDLSWGRAALVIYAREGEGWKRKRVEFEMNPPQQSVGIEGVIPFDVDGNGYLDLFFCAYNNRNSRGANFNRVASHDGADNWLFMNHGNLKFTEESDARGLTGTQYTYVGKFFDYDRDGDSDLFELNDYGPNHLWLNDGKGYFKEAKGHILGADSNYSMGVSVADWDNTGAWSVYISNMYSHAGNRIVPLVSTISPEMKRLGLVLAQGNQHYEQDAKTGEWRETGIARGINWADWAWACLFADFDNDTDKDLFVADGYTTHQDASAPDY